MKFKVGRDNEGKLRNRFYFLWSSRIFCSSAPTLAPELADFPIPIGLFPLKPRLSDHSQREPRLQGAPIPALLHAAST